MRLAELQARFAKALQSGAPLDDCLHAGVCAVDEAMDVYRANVTGAAANALALSFPTIVRLVGAAFFEQLARAYARQTPPRSGCLWFYGDAFPDFLARREEIRNLPYLADVARLDRALDHVGNAEPADPRSFLLDARTQLELSASLTLLELDWPADEIRAAIEEDEELLSRIEMNQGAGRRVLWRAVSGVMMRTLSLPSFLFLSALLKGESAGDAFAGALAEASETTAHLIDQEILRAPFARITLTETPS